MRALHRRELLAASAVGLAACGAGTRRGVDSRESRLDRLFEAHADALPENTGAGANHYPMAAEALTAMGFEAEIDDAWIDGVALYAGELGRAGRIDANVDAALGRYDRYGDWLDLFRSELRAPSWGDVVARWAPRFAPAISAAAYHGVIRTGHAVRSLRARDTPARRNELAVGLAYWASRYVELPTSQQPRANVAEMLAAQSHPWIGDSTDVEFSGVVERLTKRPIAPPVDVTDTGASARADLDALVHAAATGFLEMLVLQRSRIWLLHTVTGPAAVEWLLPELDANGARRLVEYARQSVVAMYAAFGAPFVARAHVRVSTDDWRTLIERAVDSRSVHGIKLLDALVRFDRDDDPLWRSVAAQWFEWT